MASCALMTSIWTWACSNADVVPWNAVTWRDAQAACCGLNPSGVCDWQPVDVGSSSMTLPEGWALCTAPDWEAACQGGNHPTDPLLSGAPFVYPYGAAGSEAYNASACNGADVNPDVMRNTGDMPGCTGRTGWEHLDMSGNLHEWTGTGYWVCGCDT